MDQQQLVQLSEPEVLIDFTLGRKCRATVRLKSLSSTTPIAFKIQTSSPHKFLVNPPSGLVPPLSFTTFQIILKPQSQPPSTYPRSPSDRFLIRTVLAESTQSQLVLNYTHELKLKVAFVGPFLLKQAVKSGDYDAVKGIIKRRRTILTELPSREAELVMKMASELGNSEEMVELLTESEMKISPRGRLEARWAAKGWSELHVAAAIDRTEVVESLIRKKEGGPLDCRDKEGRTPLHLAAGRGYLGCVHVLLRAGTNVDARANDGRTALYRAVGNRDRRMAEVLIEMGADPTIVSADRGRSALDVARDKGHVSKH